MTHCKSMILHKESFGRSVWSCSFCGHHLGKFWFKWSFSALSLIQCLLVKEENPLVPPFYLTEQKCFPCLHEGQTITPTLSLIYMKIRNYSWCGCTSSTFGFFFFFFTLTLLLWYLEGNKCNRALTKKKAIWQLKCPYMSMKWNGILPFTATLNHPTINLQTWEIQMSSKV